MDDEGSGRTQHDDDATEDDHRHKRQRIASPAAPKTSSATSNMRKRSKLSPGAAADDVHSVQSSPAQAAAAASVAAVPAAPAAAAPGQIIRQISFGEQLVNFLLFDPAVTAEMRRDGGWSLDIAVDAFDFFTFSQNLNLAAFNCGEKYSMTLGIVNDNGKELDENAAQAAQAAFRDHNVVPSGLEKPHTAVLRPPVGCDDVQAHLDAQWSAAQAASPLPSAPARMANLVYLKDHLPAGHRFFPTFDKKLDAIVRRVRPTGQGPNQEEPKPQPREAKQRAKQQVLQQQFHTHRAQLAHDFGAAIADEQCKKKYGAASS